MNISVIIPTYNRADILATSLKALEQQTLPLQDFEVVLVDDGSSDETPNILERFKKESPLSLKTFRQDNAGQGKARNHALDHAQGKIVVLLGDDIVVKPDFLEQHLASHAHHDGEEWAVLGLIDWHPDQPLNDYMRWMVNGSSILGKFGGHQFAYEKLKRGEPPNFNFFYTSNLSLKRKFLGKNPFDLSFSKYGWEDIELGYRLEKEKNMKMTFNVQAVGYHVHPMDESGLQRRMMMIGRSAHIIDAKYPELKKIPHGLKKIILQTLASTPSRVLIAVLNRLSGRRLQALSYYALSKKYFLQGIREGYNATKSD